MTDWFTQWREAFLRAGDAAEQEAGRRLQLVLESLVPIAVDRLREIGGPTEAHRNALREWELGMEGQYVLEALGAGDSRPDREARSKRVFGKLAHAIAVLTYQSPEGLYFAGTHFPSWSTEPTSPPTLTPAWFDSLPTLPVVLPDGTIADLPREQALAYLRGA